MNYWNQTNLLVFVVLLTIFNINIVLLLFTFLLFLCGDDGDGEEKHDKNVNKLIKLNQEDIALL